MPRCEEVWDVKDAEEEEEEEELTESAAVCRGFVQFFERESGELVLLLRLLSCYNAFNVNVL